MYSRAHVHMRIHVHMRTGASLSPSLVRRAVDDGWVRSPTLVSEFGWTDVELELAETGTGSK